MKHWYLLLMISCLLSLSAEAAKPPVPSSQELQSHVLKKMAASQAEHPLVSYVTQELQDYYGRSDFKDAKHETGWYRVDDFLQWLQAKESQLSQETMRLGTEKILISSLFEDETLLKKSFINGGFWVYLGARYIADVYGVTADFSELPIMYQETAGAAMLGIIIISPQDGTSAPERINVGIHEATHSFPYLDPSFTGAAIAAVPPFLFSSVVLPLSELATFYSQYNYGLPVKADAGKGYGAGVRDIRRTWALRPDLDLLLEYNYFVAGIVLNPTLTKNDIRTFIASDTGRQGILEVICNLVAIKQNKFFVPYSVEIFNYETLSSYNLDVIKPEDLAKWKANPKKKFYLGKLPSDFLPSSQESAVWFVKADETSLLFEQYVPQDADAYLKRAFSFHAPKVSKFYDRLLANLPKEVIDVINENWPYQTSEMFADSAVYRDGNKKLSPYKKEIVQAILTALKEVDAPPIPPLPEGYL